MNRSVDFPVVGFDICLLGLADQISDRFDAKLLWRQTGMLGMVAIPAKAGASTPYSCLQAGRAGSKPCPF
jgi:hypothetical protein